MPRRLTTFSLLLALVGCAAPSPNIAALEHRPPDFILAATVYAPESPRIAPAAEPRSRRPARYIIEADSFLRAGIGAAAATTSFPPRTRRLLPDEMDRLWLLVRDSGLLDPAHPSRIANPDLAPPALAHPAAVIWIAHSGTRTALRIVLDGESTESLTAQSLTDRLAQLAWIE